MDAVNEIDAHSLRAWLDAGRPLRLIDVRSAEETARGTIPNGEPLPLHLLPLRVDELRTGQALVIYCRTGARSAQACQYLARQGVGPVYNLRGGIVDWARAGLPLAAAA